MEVNEKRLKAILERVNLEKQTEWSVSQSENETYQGVVTWSVNRLEILKKQNNAGDCIYSPYFTIGSMSCCIDLRLLLYPGGKDKSHSDSVSLYVCFDNKPELGTIVKGQISFINRSGQKLTSQFLPAYEIGTKDMGFDAFIQKSMLNQYIVGNNELLLCCTIKIKSSSVSSVSNRRSYTVKPLREPVDYKKVMLQHGSLGDVQLRIKSEEVWAHKAILAARIPILRILFKTAGQDKCEFELKDTTMPVLKEILHYIYTDEIPILNFKLASQMYIAAQSLEIPDLMDICSAFLGANLTMENVFVTQFLGDKYSDIKLKNACIQFLNTSVSAELAKEGMMVHN